MNVLLKPFKTIWNFIISPFVKIKQKYLKRHDTRLEKKIRREIEVTLSHELKTPLTSVLAYSELLIENLNFPDKFDFKENKNAAYIINKKSKELVRFIDNVITNSVMEFNPQVFQFENVNLSTLIAEIILRFKNFYEIGEKTTLKTSITPDIQLNGNKKLLGILIFELLSNAYIYQYGKNKKEIKISLEMKKKNILLTVDDKGQGIKEKYLSRIFDKFFRIESRDNAITSGLGIGLNLCSSILELHSGTIRVSSTVNKGTTVIVEFNPKSRSFVP